MSIHKKPGCGGDVITRTEECGLPLERRPDV